MLAYPCCLAIGCTEVHSRRCPVTLWWKGALLGTAGHAGGSSVLAAFTALRNCSLGAVASVTGLALIRDGALLGLVFRVSVTPSCGLFAARPARSGLTVSVQGWKPHSDSTVGVI